MLRKLARRGSVMVLLVLVSVGLGTQTAWAADPPQGPLNVLGGTSGAGIDNSAFVALLTDPESSGLTIAATATSPSGTQSFQTFVIPSEGYSAPSQNPITGGANTTFWMATPSGVTSIDAAWSGGSQTIVPFQTPTAGTSITVVQDVEGSRNITATAIFPRFTSITDAESAFAAFHVFDADTGEWLNPGRIAVQKAFEGASFIKFVDPLVLPESALGRNIRVGFITWYYPGGWTPGSVSMPERYGGLSAAILMRLGGSVPGGGPVAALQQFAVPAGTEAAACASLAPAHVDEPALAKLRDEGWSVSYANWPNDGAGGWVCQRQPMYTSLGWVVK